MKINSIFEAIEGEGMEVGTPKTFIRLQGCSMNCITCDTPEAQDFNKGKEMTVEQIADKVKEFNHKYITITGGNPLEHNIENLTNLVTKLVRPNKFYVTLEVTGCENCNTPQISKLFNRVNFISFDMKSPSSKCKQSFDSSNIGWTFKSQYKIIVADWHDYKYAKQMIKKYKTCKIILTPCWEVNNEINKEFVQELNKKILKDNLKCRVIIQQHKIIYGHKKNV